MDHSQWTKIANDECEEYEISFFTKTVRDIRLSKKKKMTPFFMLRYLAIKRDVKCYCLGNDKVDLSVKWTLDYWDRLCSTTVQN